jgi:hypothetical protein
MTAESRSAAENLASRALIKDSLRELWATYLPAVVKALPPAYFQLERNPA